MKWIFLLCSCLTCYAQFPYSGTTWKAPSSSTWYPTNATTGGLEVWADLLPASLNGTFGGTGGTTHPATDNQFVINWTNWAKSSYAWNSDQTLHPTNFVSGGGGSSTSPRIFFDTATTSRMVGGLFTPTTNSATIICVVNCTATTGTDFIINDPGGAFIRYNAKSLEISQGTTLTSAATMGTGYYVITVVFAGGVSSHIDTNGVNMVTGTAGTANLFKTSGFYLGQGNSAGYRGNMCRIWGWSGVLSAGDIASAVAQCKTDFNIQ